MKTLKLSVPSKTFLAGEYLALRGGPTLVLATSPRFTMTVSRGSNLQSNLHPESPAGRFLASNRHRWDDLQFDFQDPLDGIGGFGASTAQFAMLNYLSQMESGSANQGQKFFDLQSALNDYQKNVDVSASGYRPSGADLMGQLRGGLTYFYRNEGKLQTYAWPFENLRLLLFKTPLKVSTHVHLSEFSKKFSDDAFAQLGQCVRSAQQALEELKQSQFLESLASFSRGLESLELIHPSTIDIVKQMSVLDGVYLARGCGALGADVVAVFAQPSEQTLGQINQLAERLGMRLVATDKNISAGFDCESIENNSSLGGMV